MTARRDLAASVYDADRDIDKLTKPLSAAIKASVLRNAIETKEGRRIDTGARQAIMRDVDRILDRIYPRRQGGASALEEMIVARSNEARRKPIASAVDEIRRRVDNELFAAMGGDGETDR